MEETDEYLVNPGGFIWSPLLHWDNLNLSYSILYVTQQNSGFKTLSMSSCSATNSLLPLCLTPREAWSSISFYLWSPCKLLDPTPASLASLLFCPRLGCSTQAHCMAGPQDRNNTLSSFRSLSPWGLRLPHPPCPGGVTQSTLFMYLSRSHHLWIHYAMCLFTMFTS